MRSKLFVDFPTDLCIRRFPPTSKDYRRLVQNIKFSCRLVLAKFHGGLRLVYIVLCLFLFSFRWYRKNHYGPYLTTLVGTPLYYQHEERSLMVIPPLFLSPLTTLQCGT